MSTSFFLCWPMLGLCLINTDYTCYWSSDQTLYSGGKEDTSQNGEREKLRSITGKCLTIDNLMYLWYFILYANINSVVRQHLPGERQVYIEATFCGLEVTIGDEHGDILGANMTGMCMYGTLHMNAFTCHERNMCVINNAIQCGHFYDVHLLYMLIKIHEHKNILRSFVCVCHVCI